MQTKEASSPSSNSVSSTRYSIHSNDMDDSANCPDDAVDRYAAEEETSTDVNSDSEDVAGEWTGGKGSQAAFLESAAKTVRFGTFHPTSPDEIRSTFSSPGKTSLREKLKQKLLRDHRARGRYENDLQQAISNPPPPPATPPPQASSSHDILASFNRTDSEDTESVLRTRDSTAGSENEKLGDEEKRANKQSKIGSRTTNFHSTEDKENEEKASASLIRLSRQALYNRRGDGASHVRGNQIRLHIYDLIHDETIVALPFGCHFPLGQCFSAVNNSLHAMGTGAYHCGLEVNGVEYAYGASSIEGATGVFSCIPKHSPGYQYRTSLDFGIRAIVRTAWIKSKSSSSGYREANVFEDGRNIMRQMASEYRGLDYDLLRKNCCTFARDACLRLGIKEKEIPTWFMNLSDAGAATQDVAMMGVTPITHITSMLSMTENDEEYEDDIEEEETGFEVIAKQRVGDVSDKMTMEIVRVVDALDIERHSGMNSGDTGSPIAMRRTWSWTY